MMFVCERGHFFDVKDETEAKFCPKCKTSKIWDRCSECGTRLVDPNSSYCYYCGAMLPHFKEEQEMYEAIIKEKMRVREEQKRENDILCRGFKEGILLSCIVIGIIVVVVKWPMVSSFCASFRKYILDAISALLKTA